MLTGRNQRADSAAVVEHIQWDHVRTSDQRMRDPLLWGRERDVLHVSVQAGRYVQYLTDFRSVFAFGEVALDGRAFLHNFQQNRANALFAPDFAQIRVATPLFRGDQNWALGWHLAASIEHDDGLWNHCNASRRAPFRASKNLLEHTAQAVTGHGEGTNE
jgi:hypothetical protein